MKNILIEIGGRMRVEENSILMLEADANYTLVHLIDGRKILVSYTLKKIAERLTQSCTFIRPNRSYLFNARFVSKFDGEKLQVSYPKGNIAMKTTLSRRKKNLIVAQMKTLEKSLLNS